MLTLDADEFRRLGYAAVDALARHYAERNARPVWRESVPAQLDHALNLPFSEQGRPFSELLDLFEETIVPHTVRTTHPRFFGFVPVPGNPLSVLGQLLADGVNIFAGSWQSGAAAAVIERQVIAWLCREVGLPDDAGGLMVSGGSHANLTALAAAVLRGPAVPRESLTAYFTVETHSSVERALRVLGLTQQRKLRGWDELPAWLARDRARGLHPRLLIANAGTTSTGEVDPLPHLASVARQEGLWFHADAAYGGPAVLCDQGRAALAGLDQVDSLALDPHKWLFQPAGSGCVLVRRDAGLVECFRIMPDYLRDVYRVEQNRNYCDRGIELTRPFRALPLWLSLQGFGIQAFRDAIAKGFRLAEEAERMLRARPQWEVVTPARLAIVTFRRAGAGDEAQVALIDRLRHDGHAMITSTRVGDRTVLRLCTINPRTEPADLASTLARLEQLAQEPA